MALFLLHTIGKELSTTTTADSFMTKYLFPGGNMPSIVQIGAAVEESFVMEDWHLIGPDYDRTLMAWFENFDSGWDRLKAKYGERFYRLWKYYLLDASRYFPLYPIEATRGCAHACSFCSTRYVHGYSFRTRPVDHVIADVERGGDRIIAFLDDNLSADEEFAKRLFMAMIPYGKKFFMQSHVLLAENEELLSLAAKGCCLGVLVGVECVSAAALSEANKGFNRVERLKDNIARFHDRGILVDGGIIFGFDTDTPDVFDRTMDVLEKIKIDSVAVNILIPYPGTEFYKKFEREGRIICADYTRYPGC